MTPVNRQPDKNTTHSNRRVRTKIYYDGIYGSINDSKNQEYYFK